MAGAGEDFPLLKKGAPCLQQHTWKSIPRPSSHGLDHTGGVGTPAFRRSDLTCVLYTGGRPLAWTLVEASRPDVQNPSRFRGIWERPPVAPPLGLDSSPVAPAVSAPGCPWTWGSVQTVPAPRGRSLTPGWLIHGPVCSVPGTRPLL